MVKKDLCFPCSVKLKEAFAVTKIHSGINQKITCAECGRRRYGSTYEISKKQEEMTK